MHPKALLDACAELVRLTLKFDHPADAIVARFFRDNRGLGPRERATMAETVYTVLRKKQLFDHLAPSGSGRPVNMSFGAAACSASARGRWPSRRCRSLIHI